MPGVRVCQCPGCQQDPPQPEHARHHQMNLFLSRLNEAQRRWYVALEADRVGPGGERLLAQITGLDAKTIRRGQAELAQDCAALPADRVRQPGGGRPAVETKSRRS